MPSRRARPAKPSKTPAKTPVKRPAKSKGRVPPKRTAPQQAAPRRSAPRGTPAPRKAAAPASRSAPEKTSSGLAFPIEIDPRQIESTLKKLGDEVGHWAKKGRYTKVRFKFRGKQLLPDLPLAAVVAAEGLTFYWGGILRALLFNFGTGAVFGVELVNDSEKQVALGKERLLRGDLDEALELFRKAASMDRDNPHVHLNIGIALKLRGDRAGARQALERAKTLDPEGAVGQEAEKILSTLPSQMIVTQVVQSAPPRGDGPPSGAV